MCLQFNTYKLKDLDINSHTTFPDMYRMPTRNEEGQPNPGAIEYNLNVDRKKKDTTKIMAVARTELRIVFIIGFPPLLNNIDSLLHEV